MSDLHTTTTPLSDEIMRLRSELERVKRNKELMLRNARYIALMVPGRKYQELWVFVRDVCGVGSTSASEICRELGWNPHAFLSDELPRGGTAAAGNDLLTRNQVAPLVEALQACRHACSVLGYTGLPLGVTVNALNHARSLGLIAKEEQ